MGIEQSLTRQNKAAYRKGLDQSPTPMKSPARSRPPSPETSPREEDWIFDDQRRSLAIPNPHSSMFTYIDIFGLGRCTRCSRALWITLLVRTRSYLHALRHLNSLMLDSRTLLYFILSYAHYYTPSTLLQAVRRAYRECSDQDVARYLRYTLPPDY